MNLTEKVKHTIEQYAMAAPGDRIVVGLSGGADSLCLTEVLLELGFSLRVVHVHHGLRAGADSDEDFVEKYCRARGLKLTAVHVQAGEYAAEHGLSTEEAGRILRLEAFEDEIRQWEQESPESLTAGEYRIALAHHLEDSAETLLFNLCRGSRIAGLSGICPSAGRVIHPLITCSREEIESYLSERDLAWCTDETNGSDDYTRNRTRHRILPMLERDLNPAATRHIAETALEASECEDYLRTETSGAMEKCCEKCGSGLRIDLKPLRELHPYLRKRVLYEALVQCAGRKKDITADHVELLRRLSESGGSSRASLPYGLIAVKTYDSLLITAEETDSFPEGYEGYPLKAEDYSTRVFSRPEEPYSIPSGEYTKWFDYDKITPTFLFRKPCEGDRITIGTDGTRKRLSRCFIDSKVPCSLRKGIVLPASGDEILWIPGYRISAKYPVTEETENILEIRIRKQRSFYGDER